MKPVRVSIDVPQAREDVYDFIDVLANHERLSAVMPATLGDGGELERAFGRRKITPSPLDTAEMNCRDQGRGQPANRSRSAATSGGASP